MKSSQAARALVIATLCAIGFSTSASSAAPRCEPVTLATGVERCLRTRADGTIDQHWDAESEAWAGAYVQADEPIDNYCGPTAAKNFLSWYGTDEDYAVLGDEMRTNTWYTHAGFGGFGSAAALLTKVLKAGTLPEDLRTALARRAPDGYTACIKQNDGDFENIRSALAGGDQVVLLESRGSDKLHWAVATGLYLEGERVVVRLANSPDRDVDEFVRDWSLSRVGDPFERQLLASLFGLRPYTMIRWIPRELADGASCP